MYSCLVFLTFQVLHSSGSFGNFPMPKIFREVYTKILGVYSSVLSSFPRFSLLFMFCEQVGSNQTGRVIQFQHFNQPPVSAIPSLLLSLCYLLVIQRRSPLHCSFNLWVLASGFQDLLYPWTKAEVFSITGSLSPISFFYVFSLSSFYKILRAKRSIHVALISHLKLTTFTCIILLV